MRELQLVDTCWSNSDKNMFWDSRKFNHIRVTLSITLTWYIDSVPTLMFRVIVARFLGMLSIDGGSHIG